MSLVNLPLDLETSLDLGTLKQRVKDTGINERIKEIKTALKLDIALNIAMEMPGNSGTVLWGAILLMMAFLISAFIMGMGHRFLGLDLFRVRMTIGVGFFILCALALIIYYNLQVATGKGPEIR